MKALAQVSSFCPRTFISLVTQDLGAQGVISLGIPPESPKEVRSWVKSHLDNAVQSLETIPVPQFAAVRQLDACLSKLETYGAVSSDVRRTRALEKFNLSEKRCRIANRRIKWYSARPHRMNRDLRYLMEGARLRIARWLAHPMGFEEFNDCSFGPGVTFGMSGADRHVIYKICGDQTCTPRARQLASEVLLKLYPNWAEHLVASGRSLRYVRGNRVTFVPKSSEIFRTIAVEPSLNVFLQNGIDRTMRRRVRPFGLTLDRQDRSITTMKRLYSEGRCATIDLSSASDSVAREAVRWMLPGDWYRLCDTVRSPEYTLDKGATWSVYEKFSSMGNGTTFPIESIIFFALAQEAAAMSGGDVHSVRVYGDDIVTEPRSALLLIEGLRFLGFRCNTDKTFLFGRFRECCGVDILDGIDVRPVYLRKVPKQADEVASLHNRLANSRYCFAYGSTLHYLRSLVDRPLYGPSYLGSGQTEFVHPSGIQFSVDEWYAGKCSLSDSYFFGPRVWLPRSERWQTSYGKLDIWSRSMREVDRSGRRLMPRDRYIGFLYGLGNRILRPTSELRIRTFTFSGYWPEWSPHQAVYDAVPGLEPAA